MDISHSQKVVSSGVSDINLPYDPQEFPRESSRHYITADKKDIQEMLHFIDLESLDDLFSHIPGQVQFTSGPAVPDELDYESAVYRLSKIAGKSNLKTSFIGDALPHWQTHPIVEFVSKLRPLST